MNLINKLKIVAGFTSNKEEQSSEHNYYQIVKDVDWILWFLIHLLLQHGQFPIVVQSQYLLTLLKKMVFCLIFQHWTKTFFFELRYYIFAHQVTPQAP